MVRVSLCAYSCNPRHGYYAIRNIPICQEIREVSLCFLLCFLCFVSMFRLCFRPLCFRPYVSYVSVPYVSVPGVRKMRLMTNNPKKIVGLEGYGLKVVERVPVETKPHDKNIIYLKTKKKKLGHMLDSV
ncbi:MAG: hypothetical protein KJ739_01845 [Nitrospinae bacterium]|nr:hypothetical protein [Nitrospinota bacterium]